MRRKTWSIAEVEALEQALITTIRSHAQKHERTVSAVRGKAMNLLVDIRREDVEAA